MANANAYDVVKVEYCYEGPSLETSIANCVFSVSGSETCAFDCTTDTGAISLRLCLPSMKSVIC